MRANVGDGLEVVAVPQHGEGFVSECRKRGEAAEDTDEDERSRLRTKHLARFCESASHADCDAAEKVDNQGPEREGRERCVSLDQSTEPIPGECAQESSGADGRPLR